MYHRVFNYILLYHFPFSRKTYWVPCLCKFVQLPCDFALLQALKETSEVATGAKCTQLHYSKTKSCTGVCFPWFYCPMNLHYSKTMNKIARSSRMFYCPMNLHYSKTSKEDWSCYQCMYHRASNYILSYHSLLSEKHIECHACANLFNYPAILHLFKCSNRHLKLLPAQKSRKYTTPKL